ncbi:MAG TPA: preprotein translocase subunit YajC [Acidimicrobiia bacterium]
MAIFPVLMVGAIYLLLWRPQQRRIAAVRRLQNEIQEGDDVLTTSGIYGRITKLGESEADLEIAPGTVIHIARGAIGQRIGPESLPQAGDPHDGETGAD